MDGRSRTRLEAASRPTSWACAQVSADCQDAMRATRIDGVISHRQRPRRDDQTISTAACCRRARVYIFNARPEHGGRGANRQEPECPSIVAERPAPGTEGGVR